MAEYLAPGVFVEEVQSGNKPIEGVSTSTAGIVGVTERGPVNVPQLITSYADFRRLFGGYLPEDEFTDGSQRVHSYLPHAMEGFFLNGGKRAYITRVLPSQATFATRELFYEDPALLTPGDTVLLRHAQQGSGTNVNLPLLYVLDPANFSVNDWIRIGDGSRTEYKQVAALGTTQRHVALNFPLQFAHGLGAPVEAMVITPSVTLAPPNFTLVNAAAALATEIDVTGASAAALLAALPPAGPAGATQLFEIGNTGAAEYAFATGAEDIGGGNVRLTLSTKLRMSYAATTAVTALDIVAGTTANLEIGSSEGDLLVYPDNVSGNFLAVANIVIFDAGTASQEVAGIGELSSLPLTVATYDDYRAGTIGQLITAVDDDRQVTANPDAVTVILDRVDGLVAGMTLTLLVGGNPETHLVDAVDSATLTVTLRSPGLSGVAAGTVTLTPKTLTKGAAEGEVSVSLNERLGLSNGDVIRLGTDEIATIVSVVGERGAAPDAGSVILRQPLRTGLPTGTQVRRQFITVSLTQQPVYLPLGAADASDELWVNDGTGFVAGDVLRLTFPDTTTGYHRLSGNAVPLTPRDIELSAALEFAHDSSQPVVERSQLFELEALDAGAWGNRLLVSCKDESRGLASSAQVLNANPPPGPGLFSSLQLSSLTGVESGTILEMIDPAGTVLPLLKVRSIDRSARLAVLDAPGLQAAHISAHNNAILAGTLVEIRSREFSLTIMLRQRPDPAVPSRNDDLLDQEMFRFLSMDWRHSRYVMKVVGATWTPGSPTDDLGIPLRHWDRRSEGTSLYVRVQDSLTEAATEVIRLGPEALEDVMFSGLRRAARHPFSGGDDAVLMMGDAMYVGVDDNEPELRTGIYALKNLLNISLVAVPGQVTGTLQQALIDHCELMRYRFAVLDGPPPPDDTLVDVQTQRQQYDTKYAALYHPWLKIPDPFPTNLATYKEIAIPPSGHMLGIYADVDNERGVHVAPANRVVRNISGLSRYLTKGEQEIVNPYPVNINVIRDFRINNRGIRVWGARCITSDNDYKYVNVRRLLIFIEDSIDRGLQWVVFEPNAEALWARVRRSVTNFLTTVWRNGALEGTTVEQAFFVKCDRTTMTRDDIDNGRLICVIGVAPVKPAEFVIIRIGLWTADATE
jgi:phage tail sheath protein FI